MCFGGIDFWIVMFERLHRGDRINTQMREYETIMLSEHPSLMFVRSGINPCVRHYYEYGKGKIQNEEYGYPNKLFLQKGGRHAFSSDDKKYFKPVSPSEVAADYYFLNLEDINKEEQSFFIRYKDYRYIFVKQ